jgi:hypothetical protein
MRTLLYFRISKTFARNMKIVQVFLLLLVLGIIYPGESSSVGEPENDFGKRGGKSTELLNFPNGNKKYELKLKYS